VHQGMHTEPCTSRSQHVPPMLLVQAVRHTAPMHPLAEQLAASHSTTVPAVAPQARYVTLPACCQQRQHPRLRLPLVASCAAS
jgi:hypothetical protein